MLTPGPSISSYLLAALDVVMCLIASAHALLHKRDTRAATGWIGLIWLSPIVGAALYLLLGINRINRIDLGEAIYVRSP
jgi:cardiolipin synthase